MKISLIDNGLDSLAKGYDFLKQYEDLKDSGASDIKRFSKLKDAVLSIQHGIEILFKHLLKERNEILLFSEINQKLKQAYKKKKQGEITEIFESDGVYTVSFKESIERVTDILGIEIDAKLEKIILKIEKWRNGIIHSAILLNENEVSSVLSDAMSRLDDFFGPAIGEKYQVGQGRQELDRAYRIFKATYGKHDNTTKDGVVTRLITALSENGIKRVTSPGVFITKDPNAAFSILQGMQGDVATYGCDMINMHCSGKAYITKLTGSEMTISSEDISTDYRFNFSGLLVYIPKIEDDFSPLIFLYSSGLIPIGTEPKINEFREFKTQEGLFLTETKKEIWLNTKLREFYRSSEEDEPSTIPVHKAVFRFLSKGMICFMNIQSLSHGKAKDFLYSRKFDDIDYFHEQLIRSIDK